VLGIPEINFEPAPVIPPAKKEAFLQVLAEGFMR